MLRRSAISFVLLLALISMTRASAGQPTADAASMNVTRYSDTQLSQEQTLILNEASKLSYACRMFRYLFDRWPNDIKEIESKTTGIDFAIFKGNARVAPATDDSAEISVFDGVNTLSVQATPIDFALSDRYKAKAKVEGFKIHVGTLKSSSP